MPPPPSISMPVWSLACPRTKASRSDADTNIAGADVSMNIVTFATPVSVAQPKLWVVSLYHDTLTKDSFCEHKRGMLQLLQPNHKHLVPILGKRSGYEEGFSKEEESSKLGFPWYTDNVRDKLSSSDRTSPLSMLQETPALLPQCPLYIELELVSLMDAGDHVVALCEVVGIGEWKESISMVVSLEETPTLSFDPKSALYTAQLRKEGII